MKKTILNTCLISALACSGAYAADDAEPKVANNYVQTHFVANKAKYSPKIATEPKMINAWGIAIRPKGAGGHFWVTAKDVSYEYVGDVKASPDETLRTLHQDKLKAVKLPVGGDDKFATGTVFSDSKDNFVITQNIEGVETITAPAKFLFASDGGIISAWTERKHPDGTFDRSGEALAVIDQSKEGSQFFGLAISHNYDRLYAADFGEHPSVKVFDGKFKPESITFDAPFDDNKNGKVDAGEYAPFN
ncbi:MAG: TIGR03118 family protein, partial [Methylocystaceae bacterium]|nr:TIGR03118 family protein [Methylocystaceae bacterium]